MDKILKGVLRYRAYIRDTMVKQFEKIQDNPTPTALFFTCMDSRMLPTRFTQTNVGDMFIVRNAGNIVPHCSCTGPGNNLTTEPAALNLACVVNDVQHVIVCGHSDCKAMNALRQLHMTGDVDKLGLDDLSPLQQFLVRYSKGSLEKFDEFLAKFNHGLVETIQFQGESPDEIFHAYIDPEDRFSVSDKLSQINCLQQLQNIASYPMLSEKLKSGFIKLHAMWFDIYTGNIYLFSRERSRFVEITTKNMEHLAGICLAEGEELEN